MAFPLSATGLCTSSENRIFMSRKNPSRAYRKDAAILAIAPIFALEFS